MALSSTEEIIEDIRQGKMVVIMDDEDRENEGDLIMAASLCRPEDINFMASYGRGLICLTLTAERCNQLRLPPMVQDNKAMHSTAFTISIEAAEGVTTGISAADRAVTVQAAVKLDAKPEDLVQPGHIFPLAAQSGGVLTRAGHTEAGCDLARLAGLEPASVIVEILNDDGTMARRPELEVFAKRHNLKMGTISDLIHYRIENEKHIERVTSCQLPTEFGDFELIAYQDIIHKEVHLALVMGEIDPAQPTLVRVHMENALSDLFSSTQQGTSWPLRNAMRKIAEQGSGVIVMLRDRESTRNLIRRIEKTKLEAMGSSQPEPSSGYDPRTIGTGAQILADLGVRDMRVLSAPRVIHGLSGFDLNVIEYVECD